MTKCQHMLGNCTRIGPKAPEMTNGRQLVGHFVYLDLALYGSPVHGMPITRLRRECDLHETSKDFHSSGTCLKRCQVKNKESVVWMEDISIGLETKRNAEF